MMTMLADTARITGIIASVAETEILPRFQALGTEGVRAKSHPGDLVTDADVAAERVLTARLTEELPGSVVVGEEAAFHDPSILDRIQEEAPVWIVDPVDGTSNFAHGRPTFATAVALCLGGRTEMAWLHDPITGRTIVARHGGGAWDGERRLQVSGRGRPLAELCGSPGYRVPKIMTGTFGRHLRHGSAAHDYMALVDGPMHFAVYRRLMPWDHAAGILIHREAGGVDGLLDGTPYAPTMLDGTLVIAPDKASWKTIRDYIARDAIAKAERQRDSRA